MFHVAAFFENIDNASIGQVNALADQVLTIEANRFALRREMKLLWAAVVCSTVTRARLVSPSLRQITNPDLIPYNVATEPGSDPNVCDWRSNPFTLPRDENLELQTANSGALAVDHFGIFALTDSALSRPNTNPIFTLRGTSSTALTADTWSEVSDITWDDDLPQGTYQVVGARFQSTGCIAGRLRFEDQLYRPGTLGNDGVEDREWLPGRRGGLGVWGRFNALQMPTPQFLAISADTDITCWIDLQKA